MRSWMKRVLGVVLTLALLVAMIPVTTANAATKKITMYVGESFTQCHLDKVFYDEISISYAVMH